METRHQESLPSKAVQSTDSSAPWAQAIPPIVVSASQEAEHSPDRSDRLVHTTAAASETVEHADQITDDCLQQASDGLCPIKSNYIKSELLYNTDDESSDWEAPVDVDLEDSPLLLQQRKSSKAKWSTVKVLTKLVPLSRSRSRYPWTQMAGHQGSFLAGERGTILKLLIPREERNLKQLMEDGQLKQHLPHYYGTVVRDGAHFVQLQDLLCEFTLPCVMDIKMGIRTYLEEELEKAKRKPTPRKDLFLKMISIDAKAPTEEEKRNCAITKPRYMQFRDDMSSTSSLGFRIEGIKTGSRSSKDYKDTRTRNDVRKALTAFVGDHSTALEKYLSLLDQIEQAQQSSPFFLSHEMVGSSLLFVHDNSGKAGVWMIDFAKCCPLPITRVIDHRSPWVPGNYEDGYLFGLDNIKSILQDVRSQRNGE